MTTTSSTSSSQSSLIQQLQQGKTSSTTNYDTTTAEGVENRFLTLLVTQMHKNRKSMKLENSLNDLIKKGEELWISIQI